MAELASLQRELLGTALDSVRPGGVVAYVTCSPHLAETRDVVTAVAQARDDVTILDAPAVLAEVPRLRCADPGSAPDSPSSGRTATARTRSSSRCSAGTAQARLRARADFSLALPISARCPCA